MFDQWIKDGGKYIKVITMDGHDVSAQLQQALDDKEVMTVILIGKGIIKSTVSLKRKCAVFGFNADLLVEGDIQALKFETEGIQVKGINFYASNEQGIKENTGQCAIHMGQTLDNSVTECAFDGFGYCAVTHSKAVGYHQGNRISHCIFKNNTIGFSAFERGEYNQLTQCTFYHNKTAILIQGGNTNISGCIISDNDIGVSITGGDNHGHGVITGCSINHNNRPFVIKDVSYGFMINGCPIYCGEIFIENTRYIKFNGCDLSHILFRVRSSKNIYIRGCHLIQFEPDVDDKDSLMIEKHFK